MTVLHVIDSLDVGGAETLLTGLCALWAGSAIETEVYVLRGGGLLEDRLRQAGVTLHVAGRGSVYSPIHIWRLARFLRRHPFHIIHVHLYPAQLWVCLAVRLARLRTPVVTTEHSTSNRRRTGLLRWLDRRMYGEFAAIAAISDATRRALAAHIGEETRIIRVVPNGVDPGRFRFSGTRQGVASSDGPVVLCVGSLTRVKDQATIIRAIAKIDRAKLLLAGDGPLRGELEALASELGVASRVEFLGVRQDIPELIASSDLYVQSSIFEGFCLAAVEAMCGRLPCIVARNSGLQEVAGAAGLYFEPGNDDELASAIRALARDPDERAAMADRGVAQAARFTLRACSEAYERLYRETIRLFSPIGNGRI